MASLTATVTHNVTKTVTATAASATSTLRAAAQGGIFEGLNPTHYNVKDPITLFIIQATLVIALTRLLHWPLSKLRQPRVIAEVITGILLGPSVMGRIPGFTNHIFPTASMPAFTLAANLGLVLFLFLVGLEVDLRFLVSNWRIAISVGFAGMALPFGFGFAIAYGLYHEFRHEDGLVPISFGIYALFVGVALAITAFPVLCRILTSLKLLGTPVGVIVLSAGVGNDVVGWVLLALCVALVNSGAGLTALYIFLVAFGYCLFLAFLVRPAFLWILRRTGSLTNGPTQGVVALTIFMTLASAFFTGVIGVHPIFGAFMIGLICPHEGGFAIKLTEKIEDLISVLLLPLYFALSGLNTNLGLLNNGITWAYVVGVTAIAFITKIAGGTLASRLNGLVWRESFTIGCLMSCKGLVELIVLNIGLQAKILSSRTFTIFVVMALVTTFATTPLTVWLYPPWYQQKLELWKKGKIDWDGNPLTVSDGSEDGDRDPGRIDITNKLTVYLRTDGLSSLFSVMSFFTGGHKGTADLTADETRRNSAEERKSVDAHVLPSTIAPRKPVRIHGLRLMELTERNSSVMQVSEIEDRATRDPIIKAFGTSARGTSRNVTISGQIAVVPNHDFPTTLINRARDMRSDMILLPWSETGSMSEYSSIFDTSASSGSNDPLANRQFANLALEVFDNAISTASVGVFIDKSLLSRAGTVSNNSNTMTSPIMERATRQLSRQATGFSMPDMHDNAVQFRSSDSTGRHQIRVLFTGSNDDLFAVRLALQFAQNTTIDVRIVKHIPTISSPSKSATTTHSDLSARTLELETIRYSIPASISARVKFEDVESDVSTSPVSDHLASALLLNQGSESGDVTLIVGRSITATSDDLALSVTLDSSTRPLGPTAAALINRLREPSSVGGVSLLVVQAKCNAHGTTTVIGDELKRKNSRSSEQS